MNEECKEVVYILKGRAEIKFENNTFCLHAGDALLIDKGEKYCWTEKTDCELCAICTPAWTEQQHKIVQN